eukprot:3079049-Prymnesium_polylepis.1
MRPCQCIDLKCQARRQSGIETIERVYVTRLLTPSASGPGACACCRTTIVERTYEGGACLLALIHNQLV